jgi:DNA-binding response OmpR family regulator
MNKKIFVVEDDKAILELIRFILEGAGYTIISSICTINIDDVIQTSPSLILLDEWLPERHGHDICKEIKANPLTMHIPVILVSAIPNISTVSKSCNADDFIEKPFDVMHLVNTIRKYA